MAGSSSNAAADQVNEDGTRGSGIRLEGRDSFPSYNTAHGIGSNVLKLHASKGDPSLCEDTESKYSNLSPISRPRDAVNGGGPTPELSSPTSSGATTPPLISPPISAAVTPATIAAVQHHDTLKPHELDASIRLAQDTSSSTARPQIDTSASGQHPVQPTRSISSSAASRSSSYGASPTTAVPETAKPSPSSENLVTPTATARPTPLPTPAAVQQQQQQQPVVGRKHSTSNASTTKPTARPGMASTQERRSKFGSFFKNDHGARTPVPKDGEESGAESETSATSSHGGGGLSGIARRLSGGAMGNKLERKEDGQTELGRQPSRKEKDASKLERKASQKKDGDSNSEAGGSSLAASLKELVGAGPKMTRKTSVTSRKSDDGKSEKGSTYGGDDPKSAAGTSLLKKYGVCEKVAIGKGATAVVRLAHKWDRSTERLYAVKEFRKRRKNETEREYVKKLTSEFCISSTLHHAYVVETVDLVQDENHHWCEVMEYCPGGDLYAAIKRGQMSQLEINSYFKQILLGVAYLHSMGVAHRDIKPENLLIDAQGMVKITDFGVSDVFRMCWEKATHLSKGLCGSEPYIAPEQFEQKEYDARLVDVWAIAIVFYCLNQQELPWRSARASDETYQAFVHSYDKSPSPPPLQALSPRECRAVVKHMLDPSPKARWYPEMVLRDSWLQSIQIIDKQGNPVATPASSQPPLGGPSLVTSLIHRDKQGEAPAPGRDRAPSTTAPIAIKPPAASPGLTTSTSPSSSANTAA